VLPVAHCYGDVLYHVLGQSHNLRDITRTIEPDA
jgi:hypothetical protein